MQGFKKVTPESWEFAHKDNLFARSRLDLLEAIKPRKSSQPHRAAECSGSTAAAAAEVTNPHTPVYKPPSRRILCQNGFDFLFRPPVVETLTSST